MSERAVKTEFDRITEGQKHLTAAAAGIQAARDTITEAEKRLFACERHDVQLFTAQAKDALDSALAQFTVEVVDE